MAHLLVIHSSINGSDSLSSSLAAEARDAWKTRHPDGTVTEVDFSKTPVPHLTAETFGAFVTPESERTDAQQQLVRQSDEFIDQLQQATELVLAVPMYNFGVPSQLRSYFDHIARAGVTFSYTPEGPKGKLSMDKVTVVATRGGQYAGTPMDTQTEYLKNFLRFLGMDRVQFVYAEGTAMGEDALADAIAKARNALQLLNAA